MGNKLEAAGATATSSARALPGIGSLLTLMFAGAKIFGYVDWSWWVVFAPLGVSIAFWTMLGLGLVALAFWVHWND